MSTVSFLYINGLHHVYHTVFTASELARRRPGVLVQLLTSTACHREMIADALGGATENVTVVALPQPLSYRLLRRRRKDYPYPREMFRRALPYLLDSDVIVATSHDIPAYSSKYHVSKPRLVYQYHGCGDRAYSFELGMGDFDLLLTPGEKYRRRLVQSGVAPSSKVAVVGYPKLELLTRLRRALPPLLDGRPTVLYAPHWDPKLSSFGAWGAQTLAWFAAHDRFNVIFAPHVLLKRWGGARSLDALQRQFAGVPNVHIDPGSIRSVDLTYVRRADIYLGDVSSQVYEFLAVKLRPCVYLEAVAMGRPSIAGDSGGVSEAVSDSQTGILVADPEDVAAVADAIQRMADEPGEAIRMARGAFERVRREFVWEKRAALFKEIVARAAPAG